MIAGEITALPEIGGKAATAKAASGTFPRLRWRNRWARAPTASRNSVAGRSAVGGAGSRIIGARTCRCGIGSNNFDELRFELFRDNLVALEAFKADQADWIHENSAEAVGDGLRLFRRSPESASSRKNSRSTKRRVWMAGFAFNLRRDLFDRGPRRAFNHASDSREMNKCAILQSVPAQYQLLPTAPELAATACWKGKN